MAMANIQQIKKTNKMQQIKKQIKCPLGARWSEPSK